MKVAAENKGSGENNGKGSNGSPDWCSAAMRRVDDGSDGLWLRLGPRADDTLFSKWFSIRLNPCVSFFATLLLFGFVVFCMALKPGKYCMETVTVDSQLQHNEQTFPRWALEQGYMNTSAAFWTTTFTFNVTRKQLKEVDCYAPLKEFRYWRKWVTTVSTWLYISTQDVWIIFLFVVLFSKYADIKLGKDDDEPDFSYIEWFGMIFCCGVATGLFFFSVGEPINHYEACGGSWPSGPKGKCKGDGDWANRYSTMSDNQRAQEAMNLTFYHWGLHGWVCYAVVGLLLGILHFRKGLPMTMKSCFFPLIGERIYGFTGDAIDVLSVVCTTFGVCTSLGLGTMQINEGLKRLNQGKNWWSVFGGTAYYGTDNSGDWKMDSFKSIWDTAPGNWKENNPWNVKTASSIAQIVADNDQQIIIIWIITAVSTASVCTGLDTGVKWFSLIALIMGAFLCWVILAMDDTFFILNLFIQTVGHYLTYFWQVGTYTGAFDQMMDGAPDGEQEYSGWMDDWTIFYWGWWIAWAPFVGVFLARISKGRTVREFIVVALIIAVTYNFTWMTIWGGAALRSEMAATKAGVTCGSPPYRKNYCRVENNIRGMGINRWNKEPEYFCSTVTKLSCHGWNYPPMIFDLLEQYGFLGSFLSVVALITLVLYFVTSSDSGSMVDDMATANGIEEPPIVQKIYWAITEGLAATGLMYMGRFDPSNPKASLQALQAASIAVGLPYTFLVCIICVSLWRTLQFESKQRRWDSGFHLSIIDCGITLYEPQPAGTYASWNFGLGKIKFEILLQSLKNALFPFFSLISVLKGIEKKKAMKTMNSNKQPSPSIWPTVLGSIAAVLFYVGWLLIFLDWIPIDSNAANTYGKLKTNSTGPISIVYEEYKVRNRYGYFRMYENEWVPGAMLDPANPTINGAMLLDKQGDRVGQPWQLGIIGWFFVLLFTAVVSAARTTTRELFHISGTFGEDVLASVFFYPTTLTQLVDTLENEDARKKRVAI